MYKWYQKHQDQPVNNVKHFIYYTQKVPSSTKKQPNPLPEPFIKPNIEYVGISPVQDAELFPSGLYVLMGYKGKDDWKKNMFFVFPTIKECDGKRIIFADHFTFVVDPSDKENSMHFHKTAYYCVSSIIGVEYKHDHVNDYFPTSLTLPRHGTVNNIIKLQQLQPYKEKLLDILRLPWTHDDLPLPSSGGGKTSKASSMKISPRPILSKAFSDLWTRAEFVQMVAFGIQQTSGRYTWSVSFKRKGRVISNRLYPAYVFDTGTDDEMEFQNMLAELAKYEAPF